MKTYILKRISLIPVTLFGILLLNFIIIQLAPGGPVEQSMAKIRGLATSSGISASADIQSSSAKYQGSQGINQDLIKELEKQFGFDKPIHIRFFNMIKNYATFNLGTSFYTNQSVTEAIIDKMPVSISLGLWSTLLIYLISIPLGIKKAVKDGTNFDLYTSFAVIIGSAVPIFLFAVFLIVFFAGGTYFNWFPLKGLTSENFDELSTMAKIADYFHHITLPVVAMTIGGFASLTMLTKNSFLDEINKPYVITAKAKGLSEKQVLYKHVFRNAMLLVISGMPAMFIKMLFTGSLLIEIIFSLNGLGLMGYNAILTRDYPIIFGTLYVFALLGLVLKLISDVLYHIIDPRIKFN